MQITLDFREEMKKVQRSLNDLQRKAVPRAANSTNNKVAVTARKHTVSDLKNAMGQSTGLSSSGFRRALALRRSTLRTLTATITASGRPLPLIDFNARKGAKGVTAKAWGKRKQYKGTFIARMPNGKRGVFKRSGKKRLPIKELFGPSIPAVFLQDDIQRNLKRVINQNWRPTFERELAYYLRKFNG